MRHPVSLQLLKSFLDLLELLPCLVSLKRKPMDNIIVAFHNLLDFVHFLLIEVELLLFIGVVIFI